jgi:hypothetical protein
LGHFIKKEGITRNLENIKAIKQWKTLKNILEVRYFMGFHGYYMRFIEGFSKIAHSITSLQKEGVNFQWIEKCEENFHHLKALSTNALVLKNIDPNKDFVVCIDACKERLGGDLNQNGHVICYESRKFKEHEINYATHDLELATIVHALRMWRHYLMGGKFELRIDHSGLKHLFEKQTLNSRKTRWLEFLSEYDFDIKHIKGKANKVANTLSTRVHEMHATTISMYSSDLKRRILEDLTSNQHYMQVKEGLQQENIQLKFGDYMLEDDEILLYMKIFLCS